MKLTMKYSLLSATVAAVGSLAVLTAQVGPAAPSNLRLAVSTEPVPVPSQPKAPAPSPCVIPPSGGPAHAYFDSLVKRPEHYCNWSLRSQAQLDSLVADPVSIHFTYDPPTDGYPDKQDAAKFVRDASGPSSIPIKQQLRMNLLPRIESGSVLFTWDWYWGKEFRTNRGGVNHYKSFQLLISGHSWWTLMANLAWANQFDSQDVVTAVSDEFRTGTLAQGMVTRSPWTPAGQGTPDQRNKSGSQYPQYHSTWTRYWIEVKMLQPPAAFTEWSQEYLGGAPLAGNPGDPEGRWHMVSLWSADENRPPRRLLYRVPINWGAEFGWNPWLTMFKFEMNTSQPPDSLIGPLIGYARNLVVLRDYALPVIPEKDTFIFQKPVR